MGYLPSGFFGRELSRRRVIPHGLWWGDLKSKLSAAGGVNEFRERGRMKHRSGHQSACFSQSDGRFFKLLNEGRRWAGDKRRCGLSRVKPGIEGVFLRRKIGERVLNIREDEAWRDSCGRSRRRLKPRAFAEGRFLAIFRSIAEEVSLARSSAVLIAGWMTRRGKAISKKHDRPGLARGISGGGVWRGIAYCRGAVSVRVVGGEVEAPGLKARDRGNDVGLSRKKCDSSAGALLAQVTLVH